MSSKFKKITPKTNTIYRGDNLEIMRAMPDKFVDMIYIDPPFFTQANYKNIWGDRESVLDFESDFFDGFQDTKDFFERHIKSNAKGLKAYLEWMRVRLVECHRILKDDGMFFMHIDYHAVHYLKVMLDEIFDYGNFRNEIIWKRVPNAKAHGKKTLGPIHDTILFYAKSDKSKIYERPTGEYSEVTKKKYRMDDDDGRGPYKDVPLVAAGQQANRAFVWKGVNARWLYSKENLDKLFADNRIFKTKSGTYYKKRYLSESNGPELGTIWVDENVKPLNGASDENTGWPTQKPVSLLERIIRVGTSEGALVFDCFAGCGTSMHAAHKLKRKWIGIDISPTAMKVNRKRLESMNAKVHIVDEKDLEISPEYKKSKKAA